MKKEYEEMLSQVACTVWDHPETGFHEFESSKAHVAFLREQGFEVTENAADTITGYVARYGSGHPVIAILGEFDALYGLGQEADIAEKTPDGHELGHGCGHHLLGVGAIGAGLLVRDYLKENDREGTVLVCGCPAEEAGSGKAYMARDGIFDDVDIALSWHPGTLNQVTSGSSLSCINCYFRFYGKASHASGAPDLGRSALDAVELTDIGVNYMREHMADSDRVHYAITDAGGKSPNVVQAFAEVNYFIRAATNKRALDLYKRVVKIAKAAAMMTETKVEVIFDEALSCTLPNYALEDVLADVFKAEGAPEYTKEELAYAAKFKKAGVSGGGVRGDVVDPEKLRKDMKKNPINTYFVETRHSETSSHGSTDVGDVSWVVPTAQIRTACYAYDTPGHSWQLVAQGKSSIAMKGMFKAADVLGKAAIRLIEEPEEIKKAKAEFRKRTGGEKYKCLIPKEIKPHVSGSLTR